MCTELALAKIVELEIIISLYTIIMTLFNFFLALHHFGERFLMCSLAAGEGLIQKKVAVFTSAVEYQHFDLSSSTKQC